MDGLSRWDLVLWVVVAYGAIVALVRLWLYRRPTMFRRLQRRLATTPRQTTAVAAADDLGDTL